jgi:uncharacterized protein DUF6542
MARPGSGLAEQATAPAARLTGRGAVLGMALVFIVGLLAAAATGATVLAGIFFVLGCVLAAWFTKPTDLLTVVVAAPLLLSGELIGVEALTASGSLLLSVTAGSVVVLATLAPWLLAGLLLTVIIAWPRGLPRSVKALRRDLRATPFRAPWASWASWAAGKPGLAGMTSRGTPQRPARAEPGSPRPQRPADPRASARGPKRPGDAQAGGPGPRGPGKTKPAAPGSRGSGSAKPAAPPPRGPGSAASAGPGPGTHRPSRASDSDEAADAR